MQTRAQPTTRAHTFFLRIGTPRTMYIISSRLVLDCDREENASLLAVLCGVRRMTNVFRVFACAHVSYVRSSLVSSHQ